MEIEELINLIVNCAFNVRRVLAQGYLESVYKKALLVELKANGLQAEEEVPMSVTYRDICVGEFRADIIVEGKVIIELKAVQQLTMINEAQLVNYLTITGIDNGLLINYGAEKFEVKRKYRNYKKMK